MMPRRLGNARSATALLCGGVVFLLGQLGLLLAMEYWRPELRDREYGLRLARLRARLAEMPGRPVVLILGSSRTAAGFRPDVLAACGTAPERCPLVFNCSAVGSGPVAELLWLRRLLADGIQPAWVVVEYWPPYWDQEGPAAEVHRILRPERLGWRDLRVLSRLDPRHAARRRQWFVDRLAAWFSHRNLVLRMAAPDWLPASAAADDVDRWAPDGLGWSPLLQSWEATAYRPPPPVVANVWQQFARTLSHYHAPAISEKALEELLALCRRRHIQPVLLFMPEGTEFRNLYPPAVRAEVDSYLDGVRRAWQMPVIDAREWIADADFVDGFHLYPRGAARFSARFGSEVLLPLVNPGAESSCQPARAQEPPPYPARPASTTGLGMELSEPRDYDSQGRRRKA